MKPTNKLSMADIRDMKDSGKLHLSSDAPTSDLPKDFWENARVIKKKDGKADEIEGKE